MDAIALFASYASPDGLYLGSENLERIDRLAEILQSWPRPYRVVIAETASGYRPEFWYCVRVMGRLMANGIPRESIIADGPSASTASEVDSIEKQIASRPEFTRVWVASSLYEGLPVFFSHVARTRRLWLKRHGRKTEPLYLKVRLTPYLFMRAALEVPKRALESLPTTWQDKLGLFMDQVKIR